MLRRAVASVLAQTYGDLEIIVVDDGSHDQIASVLEAFGDARLRYIRHASRRGASAARNSGLRESHGDYIAFLDSDDEWLPTKIERQLEVFRRSSDRTGLVYTGAVRVSPDLRWRVVVPRDRGNITRILLFDNVVVGSTSGSMVRRDVFNVVGGFDETLTALHDLDLWLRISREFDIEFCSEVLVRIYDHAGEDRIWSDRGRRIAFWEAFYAKHHELFATERLAHRHHARTA